MRIAVSGSAGTGKSTLARALADRLGVSCIAEHYDRLFETPETFDSAPERLVELINEVLEHKHRLEQDANGFVSDRCPVDLFNLWLSKGLASRRSDTAAFHAKCRHYLKKYDHIILMPWGVLPLTQVTGDKGARKRVMNRWVQFHNHSTIIGLTRQWIHPKRLVPLPRHLVDANSRLDYLQSVVGHEQSLGIDLTPG